MIKKDDFHRYYWEVNHKPVQYDLSVSNLAAELTHLHDSSYIPIQWKKLVGLDTELNKSLQLGKEFHEWLETGKANNLKIKNKEVLEKWIFNKKRTCEKVVYGNIFDLKIIGTIDCIVDDIVLEFKTRSIKNHLMEKYALYQLQLYLYLYRKEKSDGKYQNGKLIFFDVDKEISVGDIIDVNDLNIEKDLAYWYQHRDLIKEHKENYIKNNLIQDKTIQELMEKKFVLSNQLKLLNKEKDIVDTTLKMEFKKQDKEVITHQYQDWILQYSKTTQKRKDYSIFKDTAPIKEVDVFRFTTKQLKD